MKLSNRWISSLALAGIAAALAAVPATADSPENRAPSAERAEPEEDQNPCQTQLVADLEECKEDFGGPFTPGILLTTCTKGAMRAHEECLEERKKNK